MIVQHVSYELQMRIQEIELVSIGNSFPQNLVAQHLESASPIGKLEEFIVYYKEHNDQRIVILTDSKNNVAAFAGFRTRLNGKVWQAKNAASYNPYKGLGLVGKLYLYVKQQLKKSIQSDVEQPVDGAKLWSKTIPSLGLTAKIYDTETGYIIDPTSSNIEMYPVQGNANQYRYTWILEKVDHYPEQNLLTENSLLLPYRGLWYEFEEEKQKNKEEKNV